MASTIYLAKVSSRCLTKMSFRFAFKTSFGYLQDVLARCLACLGKTSLRHLVGVVLPTGTKENNKSITVQCHPGPDYTFPMKQFGKKNRSCLLVQELSFLYILHKA